MAQGSGGKEKNIMKKKINKSDKPLGTLTRVDDFLPPPEMLVRKEPTKKITLEISTSALKYFKSKGKELHSPYQKMIRNLLDMYVHAQQTN